jgi:antitoxin MazE
MVGKIAFSLEELLGGITPENIHAEIDWGPAIGNEVW